MCINKQNSKRCCSSQRGNPAVAAVNNPTNATFKITETKLYVPVVTLSTEDDDNFLRQLKSGFKNLLTRINTDRKLLIRLN